MSLYETGESNGKVSLTSLFENKALADEECISDLTIDGIIQAACRGGWPSIMNKKTDKAKLMISGSYFDSLCEKR